MQEVSIHVSIIWRIHQEGPMHVREVQRASGNASWLCVTVCEPDICLRHLCDSLGDV
jgi:hypothetical protein